MLAGEGSEFGKIPKTEMNTAVIFKEKRTNQILQNKNEKEMMWKQSKISVVYLEASFIVITFKKDEIGTCHKKAYFLSHSNIFMLSSGQTQLLQKCHWYFHLLLVLFSLDVDVDITRSTMNSEFTFASLFWAQEFVKRLMSNRGQL